MGLGKTLQTISFLAYLKYAKGVPGPHLIICPLSVLSSWMAELKRFCPSLRAIKLHSSDQEERKRLMNTLAHSTADIDVVVTTYEMAKSQETSRTIAMVWWRYLVIDEGHVIKNDGSLISQAVRRIHFAHALLLTGTPLQNNLHELWSLLNFLYPEVFASSDAFDEAFELNKNVVDNAKLAAASSLLQPFMLRRTKEEVEKGMPPKLETTISCPLSEMQLFWYKRLLLRESGLLKILEQQNAEKAASGGTDWKRLSSLLMQLRKCCNHPFLFQGVSATSDDAYEEELIHGSGKFQLLDRLLAKLFEKGHRVVLFSQFTSTLDLLGDFLHYRNYKFCRLDGSTNRVQRTVDINAFNMIGSSKFVFLMSTRAGGLGINCQTADTCILFDSDWNPQVDLQAMARVHRIGQTKVVHLYRLVSRGTVEERIVQRAEKKLYLDKMVNQTSDAAAAAAAAKEAAKMEGGEDAELSVSETISMLKFGAACCFEGEEGRPPTDAELDLIIDRTRDGNESLGAISGGKQHTAADFDATAQMLNIRELQGATIEEAMGGEGGGASSSANDAAAGAAAADGEEGAAVKEEGAPEEKKKRKRRGNEVSGLADVAGMFGGGTYADIGEAWEQLKGSKRESKKRFTTTYVEGVGDVEVLNENIYSLGGEMANSEGAKIAEAKARSGDDGAKTGRQVAGRDFAHEKTCLVCWQPGSKITGSGHSGVGGTLRGCDFCPTAFHLSCINMSDTTAKSWSGWACPHHQCDVCSRKANAVGGLLFRCSVCPKAYCEDHLPPDALIMGECPRFVTLGQRHPKQACYILHSPNCVEIAHRQGIDCGEASASAAAILGSTGVDTTEQTAPGVVAALRLLLEKAPHTVKEASPDWVSRSLDNRVHGSQSALDHLHDLLFDTDLWSEQNPGDEHRRKVASQIGAWGGAAAARKPDDLTDADYEAAAATYLRLVRVVEGCRTAELAGFIKLLGVRRLLSKTKGVGGLALKVEERQLGRKTATSILALFLTLPNPLALVLDERADPTPSAVEAKKAKEQGGDPGFFITGPPLPERLYIENGVLYEEYIPPPPGTEPGYNQFDDSDEEGPMHSVTVKPTAKPPKPEKQVVPPLPAKVILVGLQSEQAKHLNEREALCVRFYHERPELNRYVVEIEGVGNKSLALSNLKFIEPPKKEKEKKEEEVVLEPTRLQPRRGSALAPEVLAKEEAAKKARLAAAAAAAAAGKGSGSEARFGCRRR